MNKQQDNQQLLDLIRENEGIIYKICNSYCANPADRPDLAQEIVYQLLKSYQRFDASLKFSTWMYRVTLNVAISFYRKTKTGNAVISWEENAAEIAAGENESEEMERNIKSLEHFIQALKELDKALMLLYLEEKTYKEISEILGITETNTATRISRIKEKLRQQFLHQNK